jgi:transcriptional regulator with XRE-family HTH domain
MNYRYLTTMSETTQMVSTLKKCLKAKGMTYRDLALKLNLSEPSVKRLFAEQSFSLKRLEQICQALDLSFYNLAKLSAEAESGVSVLTIEQEKALAENPKLMVFFYLVLNGRELSSITEDYKFTAPEAYDMLASLEKVKLVERYPHDKVKLLVFKNIVWNHHGPLRKKYEAQIQNEFLESSFAQADEKKYFSYGKLSESSRQILMKKIDRLTKDFNELLEIDKALPGENRQHVGLLINYRPWVFSLIRDLKRKVS